MVIIPHATNWQTWPVSKVSLEGLLSYDDLSFGGATCGRDDFLSGA